MNQLLATSNISPYLIDKLVLSHSSRSNLDKCSRKFEFRQMYGDLPFREDAFVPLVGKALHTGFETWMMTRNEDKAIIAFGVAYPHELEFLEAKNQTRSFEAAFVTLQALMKTSALDEYEIARIKLPSGEVKFAVEVPFAIEIVGSPFPFPVYFVGFIDAILQHRFTGEYLVSDLKTTRAWANDLSPKYEYDEQTVPYGVILSHVLGEEFLELTTSYLAAYVDILEPKIQLHKIKKTQDMLHDWHIGLCDHIAMLTRYHNRRWFKRATSGETCFAYSSPCEFKEFCAFRDPEILNRMLQGKPRKYLLRDELGNETVPWITAQLNYIDIEKGQI